MALFNTERITRTAKTALRSAAFLAALVGPLAAESKEAKTQVHAVESSSYSLYRFKNLDGNSLHIIQGAFGRLEPYLCDTESLRCEPEVQSATAKKADTLENSPVTFSKSEKNKPGQIVFHDAKGFELARYETTDQITNGIAAPDGASFAYYVPAITNETNTKKFVLLHLEKGKINRSEFSYTVAQKWEMLTEANRLHSFSPDGSRYAFIEDSDNFPAPRIVPVTEGLNQSMKVGWQDLGVVADILFVSNNTLLLQANTKSSPYDWSLHQIDIERDTHKEVLKSISILDEIKRLVNGKVLVPVMDGPNMKPMVYDPATYTASSFSGLNWSKRHYHNKREIIDFSNHSHGVLVEPEKTLSKNAPLIVWLHGGPFRQVATDFHSYPSYATYDWMLDEVAARGAAVLKLDYPGSYGYGNSYVYSLTGGNGVTEIQSVIDDIREFKALSGMKGDTHVVGNSYGGYMAAKLIADYPQEIRSAIPINGVFDWRTLLDYLRTSIFNVQFGGLYDPKHPTPYENASITMRVPNLTSRNNIMVVVSGEDDVINNDQSFAFVELLRSHKQRVMQLLLPGEKHILTKASSNELLCHALLQQIFSKDPPDSCKF